MDLRSERGLTLTELTVAVVLAALVMLGLMLFYFNAQSTWVDSSTQALAQRDGTLLVEDLTRHVRVAYQGEVAEDPDSLHHTLILRDKDGVEIRRYWWNATDSLVHAGVGTTVDQGPVVSSRVGRFMLSIPDSSSVVFDTIELFSTSRLPVTMSSAASYRNFRKSGT